MTDEVTIGGRVLRPGDTSDALVLWVDDVRLSVSESGIGNEWVGWARLSESLCRTVIAEGSSEQAAADALAGACRTRAAELRRVADLLDEIAGPPSVTITPGRTRELLDQGAADVAREYPDIDAAERRG